MKHLDCFGDNRRTKDTRKIKLGGLKACCVTLIFSYSISHNFPALKRWNEKSEAKLKKSWQASENKRSDIFCPQRNLLNQR